MGCCTSSVRATEPLAPAPAPSAGIRVVHLNGHVEELHGTAITTGDATSGQSEDAVLLRADLAEPASSSVTPLPSDTPLQAEELYLLLPRSVLASASSSPAELAELTKRLREVAADEATFVEHREVGGTSAATTGDQKGKGTAPWKPGLEDVVEDNKSAASGGDSEPLAEKKLVET